MTDRVFRETVIGGAFLDVKEEMFYVVHDRAPGTIQVCVARSTTTLTVFRVGSQGDRALSRDSHLDRQVGGVICAEVGVSCGDCG